MYRSFIDHFDHSRWVSFIYQSLWPFLLSVIHLSITLIMLAQCRSFINTVVATGTLGATYHQSMHRECLNELWGEHYIVPPGTSCSRPRPRACNWREYTCILYIYNMRVHDMVPGIWSDVIKFYMRQMKHLRAHRRCNGHYHVGATYYNISSIILILQFGLWALINKLIILSCSSSIY